MHRPSRLPSRIALALGLVLAVAPGLHGQRVHDAVRAFNGMVVSDDGRASAVGRDVLAAGGNAVDAAIATGFALAVLDPPAGNIGGGGFMVIRFPNGTATALDFREKAPLSADPRMWLDANGEYSDSLHHDSPKAIGVPGTVAGFDMAHRLYGSMRWDSLVYPAVALAQDGFPVDGDLARGLAGLVERRSRYPATVAAFSRGGAPYLEGDTLRQPDLAATLKRIMLERKDGFYRGETARLIGEEMRRIGGLVTPADLELYQARERTPIRGRYRGYEVVGMPPPSSGGVALVEMLNILEGYDLASMGHNTAPYIHHLAEAMRRAYRDRARWLADEDFVDVPVHQLTSKAYAADLRSTIDRLRASTSSPTDLRAASEGTQTTHFSVVDGSGMAVSVTYTLEQWFGSGIVVPGAGFLLNNEMGDFNAGAGLTGLDGLIGTEPNLARPEQRMLSSMSPTILAKDGMLVAVVGSPGGRTIINTVLQVILNVVDFRMDIAQAVAAPRVDQEWLPDRVTIEQNGTTRDVVARLEAMGHAVRMRGSQGVANCIMVDPRTGALMGAADPRHPAGAAVGY